jgi:hypothetical protein
LSHSTQSQKTLDYLQQFYDRHIKLMKTKKKLGGYAVVFHRWCDALVTTNIARSNEILGWEGVGNRQLLRFFNA